VNLSDKLKSFIRDVIVTPEFWRVNYYLRSMKKAPHGGVFNIGYPNTFLKYWSTSVFRFFNPRQPLPLPVQSAADTFLAILKGANIDAEEILQFCFRLDTDNPENPANGNRLFLAISGGIITVNSNCKRNQLGAAYDAGEGKISYTDNFDFDMNRLLSIFLCMLIEQHAYIIHNINEIVSRERLLNGSDNYGLCNVTGADFERQGFKLNDTYYLYNIFLDTSIGGANDQVPRTVQIIKDIQPPVKLFMRCDKNLAVPYSWKVSTASTDFQKWRGITLDFSNISRQVADGKEEVIVHFDLETGHKILVYIKKGWDDVGLEFYHLNVEQLWNPAIFAEDEDIVITNYIHGTYYPSREAFSHIDFSANQYRRDVFVGKYDDAVKRTGIPIDKHTDTRDEHYKVWCVKGDSLTAKVWAELVFVTLDAPFRVVFMETIGGSYTEDG